MEVQRLARDVAVGRVDGLTPQQRQAGAAVLGADFDSGTGRASGAFIDSGMATIGNQPVLTFKNATGGRAGEVTPERVHAGLEVLFPAPLPDPRAFVISLQLPDGSTRPLPARLPTELHGRDMLGRIQLPTDAAHAMLRSVFMEEPHPVQKKWSPSGVAKALIKKGDEAYTPSMTIESPPERAPELEGCWIFDKKAMKGWVRKGS
jgi:hypothetical protein